MQLGQKIKKLRELRNLRQEYVADQLHVSQACYSKMENGHTRISVERLEKIAEILEVSLDNILHFDEHAVFAAHLVTPTANLDSTPVATPAAEKEFYETHLRQLQQENVRLKALLKQAKIA